MLIVHLEDDKPLREIMQIALLAADPFLEFHQFIDSDSAINFIKEHLDNISLFLLDIRVPGELDGIGVATQVRELGSKRPIILTSAYRRPNKTMLDTLNCTWMAKPWHLIDAPQKILPLAKAE